MTLEASGPPYNKRTKFDGSTRDDVQLCLPARFVETVDNVIVGSGIFVRAELSTGSNKTRLYTLAPVECRPRFFAPV